MSSILDNEEGSFCGDSESTLPTDAASSEQDSEEDLELSNGSKERNSESSYEQVSFTELLTNSSVAEQISTQRESTKTAWEIFVNNADASYNNLKNSLSKLPRLDDLVENQTLESENSFHSEVENDEASENLTIELTEESEESNVAVTQSLSDIIHYSDSEFFMKDDETQTTLQMVEQELLSDFINQTNIRKTVYCDPVKMKAEAMDKQKIVSGILEHVIRVITDYCIEREPHLNLREKFDKNKLFMELINLLRQINSHKKIGRFLNLKVSDYYRRKKHYSMITNASYENLDAQRKLSEKYHIVNFLKSKEENDKKVFASCIAELTSTTNDMKSDIEKESNYFESLVKLLYHHTKKKNGTGTIIPAELAKLTSMRENISNERRRLIFLQKKHKKLHERVKVSQIICENENVTHKDFEKLQTECINLSEKVKERTDEIEKLQHRFCNATHTFSITRCCKVSAEVEMSFQYKKYVAVKELNMHLDNHLQVLHKQFLNGRKKVGELNWNMGLLDKKQLMLDYDHLIERIKDKRAIIEKLKRKYEQISKTIEHLQNQHFEENNTYLYN